MNTFFQKLKKAVLYGSSFKLRPYEQIVLDGWRQNLSQKGNAVLSSQLKHLSSYQRQAREKDLCFFPLGSKPYKRLPSDLLFPCRLEACVVAFIHLTGSDSAGRMHKLRAEIHLHKGQISSIEFNQSPRESLEKNVEVTKVEILRDPMVPASEDDGFDTKRREELLASIKSKLPEEYLQLIGEGREVCFNEWTIHGLPKIRKIPQRDGNYYLLAEREGMGAVGVKEDEASGQLYYLDYGDDRGERISVALKAFLEKFDGGKVVGRF